jgi:hypothetical protein
MLLVTTAFIAAPVGCREVPTEGGEAGLEHIHVRLAVSTLYCRSGRNENTAGHSILQHGVHFLVIR